MNIHFGYPRKRRVSDPFDPPANLIDAELFFLSSTISDGLGAIRRPRGFYIPVTLFRFEEKQFQEESHPSSSLAIRYEQRYQGTHRSLLAPMMGVVSLHHPREEIERCCTSLGAPIRANRGVRICVYVYILEKRNLGKENFGSPRILTRFHL